MPKPLSFPLTTQRLIIRQHTADDVEPSYQMNLDPLISRFTCDGGMVEYQDIDRRIKIDVLGDYKKYGYGRWAVEWKATGEFIGFTGFKFLEDYQLPDLGYRFLTKYWGKGIATEAGQACMEYAKSHMNFEEIMALVRPDNKASIRVLEKLGFNLTGTTIEDGDEALVYGIKMK